MKMRKDYECYYKICGIEKKFSSLKSAKMYIWHDMSQEERDSKLNDKYINKYCFGVLISQTKIIAKDNKYYFKKTRKPSNDDSIRNLLDCI